MAIETQVPKKHPAVCPRLLGSDALVRGAASWPHTAHPSASPNATLGGGVGRRGGGGDNSQLQFCSAAAAAKSSGLLGTKNPFLLLMSRTKQMERNVLLFYNPCQTQTSTCRSLLPSQITPLRKQVMDILLQITRYTQNKPVLGPSWELGIKEVLCVCYVTFSTSQFLHPVELKYKTGVVKEAVLIFKDQRLQCFYLSILNVQRNCSL